MYVNKYYLLSDEFNETSSSKQPIVKPVKLKKENKILQNNTFINRLKKEKKPLKEDDEIEIKYGWTILEGNRDNNKIKITENPPSNKYNVRKKIKKHNIPKSFRNYYIAYYGVDKYNEMFISPYHDYNYFNRSVKNNQIKRQLEENAKKNCKCLFLNDKYRQEHMPYKLFTVDYNFNHEIHVPKIITEEILSESEADTETVNEVTNNGPDELYDH